MICKECIKNLGLKVPPHRSVPCRCSVCLVFNRDGYAKDSILKPFSKDTLAALFATRLLAIKERKKRYENIVNRYYKLLNEESSLRQMHRLVDETRTDVEVTIVQSKPDYTSCKVKDKRMATAKSFLKKISDDERKQLMEALGV